MPGNASPGEKIVGVMSGGDGFTLLQAEDFCRILHADAAIRYCDGMVRVMAVRPKEVR